MTSPASPTNRMTPLSWAMLILLAVVWGGSFFFTKIVIADIPPVTLIFYRVVIAAAALHLVLRLQGARFPWRADLLRAFLVMGLLNNAVPFTLLAWGQVHIASGLAAVLNAFTPVSTVIIAHVLTDTDKATPMKLAGVLVGLSGVAVMIGPEAFGGITDHVTAELACLGATVSYGLAAIFGRRFRGQPALVTAAGQLTGSSAIMLPLALAVGGASVFDLPSMSNLGSVLVLALGCTAFAYILFFRILSQAGATNVTLVTFLVPVSAILLGAVFLGEVLAPRHWLGMAFIALALAAIDGRLFERLRRAARPA